LRWKSSRVFINPWTRGGFDLSVAAGPTKQAEQPKTTAQLTIDQVIQMVAAKLPDDIIITTIQN